MATIQSLRQPSYVMRLILPQMVQLRAAYEGGQIFKQHVLIKKQSENKDLYKDKLDNVAALPVCKSLVDELTDIIFESDPVRELAFLSIQNAAIPTPPWVEDFIVNADLNDNTLNDVMERASTLASIEGWSWIFVDLPETPNKNNRPYLSVVPAENVIDWEYDQESGASKLTKLRVIEFEDQEKVIIMQWTAGEEEFDPETGTIIQTPTTAERYIIELLNKGNSGNELVPDETYTFPYDYPIPCIQHIPVPDLRNRYIGNSDITEAADVQRELLRLESEVFDSARFSKPLIRASANIKIPAGGGGIARGNKDDVEVFKIDVADIQQLREQQLSLMNSLDGYTGRAGTRLSKTSSTQSGISIIEERRGLHRKAATRARILQSTEEQVFTLVAWIMGIQWVGQVEYNTDYEFRDTQYRLALLETAKNLSMNPLIQDIIDKEIIKYISPAEDLESNLQMIGQASKQLNNNTQAVETSQSELPNTEIEIEDN